MSQDIISTTTDTSQEGLQGLLFHRDSSTTTDTSQEQNTVKDDTAISDVSVSNASVRQEDSLDTVQNQDVQNQDVQNQELQDQEEKNPFADEAFISIPSGQGEATENAEPNLDVKNTEGEAGETISEQDKSEMRMSVPPINPPVDDDALNALFSDAPVVCKESDVATKDEYDDEEDEDARYDAEREAELREGTMGLMGHLSELRTRITRMLIGAFIGFLLCYGVAEELFHYLSLPLVRVMPDGTKFIYTGVPEGFFVYLKVALAAGIFVASPYIFYQVWAFIAPGLYKEERRHIIPLAIASAIFFIIGALFCYFGVFPFAFKFFMSYSTDLISAMPSLDEYLGFSLKLLIAFGIVFEMPIFTFFLARLGIVTAARMRALRGYAVIGVFIVAAILTPPDVFSQLLMAGPMLILYEISIFIASMFGKKPKPVQEESSEEADEDKSDEETAENKTPDISASYESKQEAKASE